MADVTELFAIVVEDQQQGPILLETEAYDTSYDAARKRLSDSGRRWTRVCIVRLEFYEGNPMVLHDMATLRDGGAASMPAFLRKRRAPD